MIQTALDRHNEDVMPYIDDVIKLAIDEKSISDKAKKFLDDPELNELIPGFNEQFYTAQRLMGTRNYLRGIEAARQADSPQEFASWFDAEVVHEYEGPFETSKRALDGARLIAEKGLTKLTAYDIEMIENKYTNSRN